MKINFKRLLLVTPVAIALSTGWKADGKALSSQKQDTITSGQNLIVGKPLPVFELQRADGKSIKLSSVKGKVVLVDFWASWCMPCRAAIPHLKALYKQYHAKGFEIVSISIDQNSKAWKNAMLKEAMPWEQGIDRYEDGKDASVMMNALGIQSVPFAIVLDAEGNVVLINPTASDIDIQLKKIFNS
ncbi:Thiol-disulfide isomerase or thioredoxin [Mucilaginibacter gossypiicola]|uniref:Thiol-disulfide isomerase or thioredoxin n=1 Tax=Mucilaginibacter gossypiicola TaxID=551995 RepID=A0A1H8TW10_9SPHI|nr:TlpA disulfide reductase family protein [Mucilaginibacter gossypiicola]SEO95081.1 Thiol-disulfide isomerase or thioredoxin [Mucilaginibacter gossypiicola]